MLKPISRYETKDYHSITIYENYEGYYEGLVFTIRQMISCDENGNTQYINGVIDILRADCSPNLFGSNISFNLQPGHSISYDKVFRNGYSGLNEIYTMAMTLITKGIPNTQVGKLLYGN